MTDLGNLNIIVQTMVRNEADIILECLSEILGWEGVSTVVIMDGASTDGTADLIRYYTLQAKPEATIDLRVIPDSGDRFADHLRQRLLDITREHIGHNASKPTWILSLDADEIYHTSPVEAIMAAEAAGAEYIRCLVPQFWLTYADVRAGLVLEDEALSVQGRRRWYSWGHTGVFIWRDQPDHYYPWDVQKRTPESRTPHQRVYGPAYPICKHYPFRSLRQAVQRAQERRERGGREYFNKYFCDWLIDEQAVGLYQFDGKWNTEINHHRLVEWWESHGAEYEGRPR